MVSPRTSVPTAVGLGGVDLALALPIDEAHSNGICPVDRDLLADFQTTVGKNSAVGKTISPAPPRRRHP
jgi:hypothetical protein